MAEPAAEVSKSRKKQGLVDKFNRAVPYPIRLLMVGGVGYLLFLQLGVFLGTSALIYNKLTGAAVDCPYGTILTMASDQSRLKKLFEDSQQEAHVIATDPSNKTVQVKTGERTFWAQANGSGFDGRQLIAYLLAEHRWMQQRNPNDQVRAGDVVVDVGGHVGVFTHFALKRGASKVIAFEPEPNNAECFRRNFKDELASGKVILVEKGLWSSSGVLKLYTGDNNSGMASMVIKDSEKYFEVPVITLDALVDELKIDRVNFIKMDIEGAEREALAGAMNTLKRFRPMVMLDSYHLPDDPQVLPGLLQKAHADYAMSCGPCELKAEGVHSTSPHVTYYR